MIRKSSEKIPFRHVQNNLENFKSSVDSLKNGEMIYNKVHPLSLILDCIIVIHKKINELKNSNFSKSMSSNV